MIKTILGLILLFIPFLLVYKFKDKRIGFAYILGFLLAFHLVVAVFTQAFGIFNYWVVLTINLLIVGGVLFKVSFKELIEKIKKINKIDWVLVFVVIILFIQLYSVHYNYTGKVMTINQPYREVKNMKYHYPYFSDEWSAVTFIKYSLESGKLPLTNPYWYNEFFPNLELPFHSFLSEIIMLLDLDPLTNYTILTLFFGLLVCLLIYLVLRVNNVRKLAASIACLSVPYIVNSGNLPGIWNLIPIILGIISMLLGFLFMSAGRKKMALFLGFLTLVFYPPLFLFYTASLVLYFTFTLEKREKRKFILIYFFIILTAAIFVSVFTYLYMDISLKDFVFLYIKEKVFYPSITPRAIPDFSMWKVIPIPVLLFAAFGLFKIVLRKVWLVASLFVGLTYWWFYSFVFWRFIIGYARVVFSTSVLIVLVSGFGFNYTIKYLRGLNFVRKYKILTIIQIVILIMFFIFSFSYTQRENWEELKLRPVVGEGFIKPASPANSYLHEDDLKIFKGIEKKRFLSKPWKGTVIGTATSNYPLDTKQATLTNIINISYSDFMKANCKKKKEIVKKYKIDYIYGEDFDCKRFKLKGVSKERMYLYAFTKKTK